MTIKFTYDQEDDSLSLDAYKVNVRIYMDAGEVQYLTFGEGYEFTPIMDWIYGIKLEIDGKDYTLAQIIKEAEDQYSGIVAETEEENAVEARMYRELSSPYRTGRI